MISPGVTHELSVPVEGGLVTSFWDGAPDVDVLATPGLLSVLERAAAEAVAPYLQPGQITVGVEVALKHLRSVARGRTLTARATVTSVGRRSIHYALVANSDDKLVSTGTHTRAIITPDRLA